MADFKISALMNVSGSNGFPPVGFSDNFFWSGGDIRAAIGMAHDYAVKRVALSNENLTCVAVRAQMLGTKGASLIQHETNLVGTTPNPETPWDSKWLTIFAGIANKRQFFVRAVGDDQIVAEVWKGDAAFATNYRAWVRFLVNNSLCLQIINPANQPIQVIGTDPNGVVTTVTPHGFTPQTPFRFYRTYTSDGVPLKKLYHVASVTDTTHFIIQYWPTGTTTGYGAVRLTTKVLSPITDVAEEGVRKKQVGRPSGLFRGRRSSRKALAQL